MIAKVTRRYSGGFVRILAVEPPAECNDKKCKVCNNTACIDGEKTVAFARDFHNAEYGDIVEVKPALGNKSPYAYVVYVMPFVIFAFAMFLGNIKGWAINDSVFCATILGLLSFAICWMQNRKVRLMQNMSFETTALLRKNPDTL